MFHLSFSVRAACVEYDGVRNGLVCPNILQKSWFLNFDIIFGDKSKTNAKIDPKNIFIAQFTGSMLNSLEVLCVVMAFAAGRASITASARSVMKEEVQPRAGTRPQFSIPDSRARCLYSMSISSSVSMCSLTKLEFEKNWSSKHVKHTV